MKTATKNARQIPSYVKVFLVCFLVYFICNTYSR